MRPALEAADLRFSYSDTPILAGVDLSVSPGEVLGLVGPNGSGKTTALRCCYRALRPQHGRTMIAGESVDDLGRRTLARRLGVSTQEPPPTAGLTVRESVGLGRSPHQSWLAAMSSEDRQIVEESLHTAGLADFGDRDVARLSGGERQRVSVARAMATRAEVMLFDEPTNHLDLHHQLLIMDLLRSQCALGRAVIVTLHDLRLAAEYCDRLAVLAHGRVVAAGVPEEVLTPELLAEVFGVRGRLASDAEGRRLIVQGLV